MRSGKGEQKMLPGYTKNAGAIAGVGGVIFWFLPVAYIAGLSTRLIVALLALLAYAVLVAWGVQEEKGHLWPSTKRSKALAWFFFVPGLAWLFAYMLDWK
jgi:hypothetical protein